MMMISFIIALSAFVQASSMDVSGDMQAVLKPLDASATSRHLQFFNNTGFVAPRGWIQGRQYSGGVCGNSAVYSTNIATGVCIQDGASHAYMQYFTILPDVNPTSYAFYTATFSDASCTTLESETLNGSWDPNYVCLVDNASGSSLSKTVYYFPGTDQPPLPWNGQLNEYYSQTSSNDFSCAEGTVVKTVMMDPGKCFINPLFNASDPLSYQSYFLSCTPEYPAVLYSYLDDACAYATNLGNNTNILVSTASCVSAATFRAQGLPELYLTNSNAQFNYLAEKSVCYGGPTSFHHATTFTTTSLRGSNGAISHAMEVMMDLFNGIRRMLVPERRQLAERRKLIPE